MKEVLVTMIFMGKAYTIIAMAIFFKESLNLEKDMEQAHFQVQMEEYKKDNGSTTSSKYDLSKILYCHLNL